MDELTRGRQFFWIGRSVVAVCDNGEDVERLRKYADQPVSTQQMTAFSGDDA